MNKSALRLSSAARVTVVGGGLIGLGIAWRLAQRGHPVKLFERNILGSGASFAAAGMLSVVAEAEPAHAGFFELCRNSRRRWPAFAAELETLTGQRVDLAEQGTLLIARSAAERRRLDGLAGAHTGDGALRPLDRAEWRRLEPGLTPTARAVYLAAEDGQVDNRAVVAALAGAFRLAGGELVQGVDVRRLSVNGGRIAGVATSAGTSEADIVVVAAGLGTDVLLNASRLGATIPSVTPVKGELLALGMDPRAPAVRHVIRGEHVYLVPRSSGRLIVGATSEPGAADNRLTRAARDTLRADAIGLVPGLAQLEVVDHWAGLRPHVAGGLPIIGAAGPDGLFLALGHYRSGVLLTPVTADLIAGMIAGSLTAPERALAAAFGPERLAALGPTASAQVSAL